MTEPTAAPLIDRLEEQAERMESFAQAYPEAIFPPLTANQRAHAGDSIITRASAEMGRHFSRFAIAAANALREAAAALAQRPALATEFPADVARWARNCEAAIERATLAAKVSGFTSPTKEEAMRAMQGARDTETEAQETVSAAIRYAWHAGSLAQRDGIPRDDALRTACAEALEHANFVDTPEGRNRSNIGGIRGCLLTVRDILDAAMTSDGEQKSGEQSDATCDRSGLR